MLKSRPELIQDITAEFDKKRIGWLSLPYFELYEFVDNDFIVPDIPVFEIHISRKKRLHDIIRWSIFVLVFAPISLMVLDTIPSFITGTFLIFALPVYHWYEFVKRRLVLLLDENALNIENKIILTWDNILTFHFLGPLRRTQHKLIVHYLDESGNVQNKSVDIDYLDYKPKEIAAIIQSFINKTKLT